MKVELIRRIREKLSINPESKSTLLTKQQLLTYARQLQHQNDAMREILQPSIGPQLPLAQREREEKEISLVIYETTLRDEKARCAALQGSVKFYREHLEQGRMALRQHQQRAEELKLRLSKDRRSIEAPQVVHVITREIEERGNGGEGAILNLMKEFLQVDSSFHDTSSEVAEYR